MNNNLNRIRQHKYFPLSDQKFCIALDDVMGSDGEIVKKARTSYGKDTTKGAKQFLMDCWSKHFAKEVIDFQHLELLEQSQELTLLTFFGGKQSLIPSHICKLTSEQMEEYDKRADEDISLLRRLLRDRHTSPFEMCEVIFFVEVPMDCWRQWVRHRTASINEYSTRYMEALDHFQITTAAEWRTQSKSNKQGSEGYIPENLGHYLAACDLKDDKNTPNNKGGCTLSYEESQLHELTRRVYKNRLEAGVAREQARKDLPLSTMTRAYWKCDLHNIFHFLNLRMDEHAQYEIRAYANCMFNIVQELFPIASQAFKDYRLDAVTFSRMEMEVLRSHLEQNTSPIFDYDKPSSMTDREWKEFMTKLS